MQMIARCMKEVTHKLHSVFYFALSMDNWTLGSTFIGTGLNWWQAIIVVVREV